jgi:hypothetical protein
MISLSLHVFFRVPASRGERKSPNFFSNMELDFVISMQMDMNQLFVPVGDLNSDTQRLLNFSWIMECLLMIFMKSVWREVANVQNNC